VLIPVYEKLQQDKVPHRLDIFCVHPEWILKHLETFEEFRRDMDFRNGQAGVEKVTIAIKDTMG